MWVEVYSMHKIYIITYISINDKHETPINDSIFLKKIDIPHHFFSQPDKLI
jgi:hypothetical protein